VALSLRKKPPGIQVSVNSGIENAVTHCGSSLRSGSDPTIALPFVIFVPQVLEVLDWIAQVADADGN
jgi:hypothetical protein